MRIEFQIIGNGRGIRLFADIDGEFRDMGLSDFPSEALAIKAAQKWAEDQYATCSILDPLT